MKKVQSFVVKHRKGLIITSIVFIVVGILAFTISYIIAKLTPDQKKSVYGDRCLLTESLKITQERKDALKETIESYEKMKLLDVDVKCNLIDLVVEVDDSVEVDKVKEMSDKILTVFSEEELKYYDVELLVDSTVKESEKYPMTGTKHKMINGESNEHFVW